ncbi:MAG: FAD-binding domain-containing protein [Planctomycetaceae bacterium]
MSSLTRLLTLPRPELAAELARLWPDAVAGPGRDALPSGGARGGRAAALQRLATIDPATYARTRNHVDGAVTGLSPWIRHGVLSLAEVRDAALAHVAAAEQAAKLVSELGWREYWRQVHRVLGDGIHADIEAPALRRHAPPGTTMPADVLEARTGMRCIDAFVDRLHRTGWLHNHERMWLASWLVHVRGVHWRVGADWFLEHLLDGDPASNHLSWQWVAGTFSAKPYLFNRENLETHTSGVHCRDCPLLGSCDVEGSYEDLATRIFGSPAPPAARPPLRIRPAPTDTSAALPSRPLVWLTLDALGTTGPAVAAFPDAPRLFVLDPEWLEVERPALKRLVFVCECLADLAGVEVLLGDPAELVPATARRLGCDGVAVAATPCPRVRRASASIAAALPLAELPWPRFCDDTRARDLGRFSRWWQAVATSALRPTGS